MLAGLSIVVHDDSDEQAKWIRCIFELLNAPSHAVKYEAATSLTSLTQNPAAVKGTFSLLPPGYGSLEELTMDIPACLHATS
jgi:hypothetical protein